MLNSLLAHARGAADRFLDEYYHSDNFTHNPFKIAEKQTVSVQVDSILQLSPTQLPGALDRDATRSERRRLSARRRIGRRVLQTEIVPPNSEDAIVSNPLGFYVTQISWTEQQD